MTPREDPRILRIRNISANYQQSTHATPRRAAEILHGCSFIYFAWQRAFDADADDGGSDDDDSDGNELDEISCVFVVCFFFLHADFMFTIWGFSTASPK